MSYLRRPPVFHGVRGANARLSHGRSTGFGNVGLGTAPFDPASLFGSGEDGFYKEITGVSGLWQDTPPSTAISASGQTVAHVDDDSGNNNDITQGASAAEPTYIASGGKHWLDFDSGDQFISANGAFDFSTISAHFALKQDSIATGQCLISRSVTVNDTSKEFLLYLDSTGQTFVHINGSSFAGSSGTLHPHDTVTPFCIGVHSADAKVYVDGAFAETVGTGQSISYSTANLPTYFLGQDRSGLKYDGRVYAILVIDRTLTADEVADLHAYWAANLF